MGAIGGDEVVQWDKMDGGEVVNGGGGGGVGKLERILVSVRLRPLSDKEIARGDPSEWECINDTTIISRSTFPDRPSAPTAYSFGWFITSSQLWVFYICNSLVLHLLLGFCLSGQLLCIAFQLLQIRTNLVYFFKI